MSKAELAVGDRVLVWVKYWSGKENWRSGTVELIPEDHPFHLCSPNCPGAHYRVALDRLKWWHLRRIRIWVHSSHWDKIRKLDTLELLADIK